MSAKKSAETNPPQNPTFANISKADTRYKCALRVYSDVDAITIFQKMVVAGAFFYMRYKYAVHVWIYQYFVMSMFGFVNIRLISTVNDVGNQTVKFSPFSSKKIGGDRLRQKILPSMKNTESESRERICAGQKYRNISAD